jgi:hypothetical protein
MNTVKLFSDDYAATLIKMTDVALGDELRSALRAANRPDALSTGAGEKVRACHSEALRRNKGHIYDVLYMESLFGADVAAHVYSGHVRAA